MARKRRDRTDELLAELVEGKSPEEILGEGGVLKQLTKRLVENALEGEMTEHLGYEPHAPEGRNTGNSRNGKGEKTVHTENGSVEIEVPRDRAGTYDPKLVRKRQRRLEGFDDKVLSLYARGMSTREIQGHLKELYGTEVSPALISNVTDSVLKDVQAWQGRALDSVYPIVYLDALHLKMRLAVLVYRVLRGDMEYSDPGADAYEAQHRTRTLRNIHNRVQRLGFGLVNLETGEILEGVVS